MIFNFSGTCRYDFKHELLKDSVNAEVIDCRILNPFQPDIIIKSVQKTGKLLVIDGSWKNWNPSINWCDFPLPISWNQLA